MASMSETTRNDATWMRPVDEAILGFLAEERAEYPAIIANRTGAHTSYVERRCAALATHDYLEAVSGEVVYRITDRGLAHLDGSEEQF